MDLQTAEGRGRWLRTKEATIVADAPREAVGRWHRELVADARAREERARRSARRWALCRQRAVWVLIARMAATAAEETQRAKDGDPTWVAECRRATALARAREGWLAAMAATHDLCAENPTVPCIKGCGAAIIGMPGQAPADLCHPARCAGWQGWSAKKMLCPACRVRPVAAVPLAPDAPKPGVSVENYRRLLRTVFGG